MLPAMLALALGGLCGSQVVVTADPDTRLRYGPGEDFDRIAVVPAGISLWSTGKQGDWYHVRLGSTLDAWVYGPTVRPTGQATPLADARVTDITASPTPTGSRLSLVVSRPVAFRVVPELFPPRLHLDLFDCDFAVYWVRQKPGERLCRVIAPAAQASGWTRVSLDLASTTFFGCTAAYLDPGTLALDVKVGWTGPGLAGRKIVLDPGHGGPDSGATGAGGLMEKTVNLAIARKTADLLRAAGATVVLTRTGDGQVGPPGCNPAEELEARLQVAVKNRADVFVSIHTNDAGEGTSSEVAGTESYYWAPFCQPLARALLDGLAAALGTTPRHVAWRPFHVLRSFDCPRALVECGYLSNPAEEKYMAKPEFAARAAEGIVAGLRTWVDWAAGAGPCP